MRDVNETLSYPSFAQPVLDQSGAGFIILDKEVMPWSQAVMILKPYLSQQVYDPFSSNAKRLYFDSLV